MGKFAAAAAAAAVVHYITLISCIIYFVPTARGLTVITKIANLCDPYMAKIVNMSN